MLSWRILASQRVYSPPGEIKVLLPTPAGGVNSYRTSRYSLIWKLFFISYVSFSCDGYPHFHFFALRLDQLIYIQFCPWMFDFYSFFFLFDWTSTSVQLPKTFVLSSWMKHSQVICIRIKLYVVLLCFITLSHSFR